MHPHQRLFTVLGHPCASIAPWNGCTCSYDIDGRSEVASTIALYSEVSCNNGQNLSP